MTALSKFDRIKVKSGPTPAPSDSGFAADGTVCLLPSCAIMPVSSDAPAAALEPSRWAAK